MMTALADDSTSSTSTTRMEPGAIAEANRVLLGEGSYISRIDRDVLVLLFLAHSLRLLETAEVVELEDHRRLLVLVACDCRLLARDVQATGEPEPALMAQTRRLLRTL